MIWNSIIANLEEQLYYNPFPRSCKPQQIEIWNNEHNKPNVFFYNTYIYYLNNIQKLTKYFKNIYLNDCMYVNMYVVTYVLTYYTIYTTFNKSLYRVFLKKNVSSHNNSDIYNLNSKNKKLN